MKTTQRERVLTALQAGRRLTPDDAIREFRCYRLAARICELRKAGVQIECDESKGFGEYWIKEDKR